MRDEASIAPDHGVDINTLDKSGHRSIHYTNKPRQHHLVIPLLSKEAARDFDPAHKVYVHVLFRELRQWRFFNSIYEQSFGIIHKLFP